MGIYIFSCTNQWKFTLKEFRMAGMEFLNLILKKDTFNLFQICSIYLKNVIWQFFMTIVIAFIALLFFEGEK